MKKRWEWFKQMIGYAIACLFFLSILMFVFEMFVTSMSMTYPKVPSYTGIVSTLMLLITGALSMIALKGGLLYQASMLIISVTLLIISWNWQLEYFSYSVEKRHISSCYPFVLSLIGCFAWAVRCVRVLRTDSVGKVEI